MTTRPLTIWASIITICATLVLGVAGAQQIRLPENAIPPLPLRLPPELKREMRRAQVPDPPVLIYGAMGWESALRSIIESDRRPLGFSPDCDGNRDADGDGYDNIHCGGPDCDDTNPYRAPGRFAPWVPKERSDPEGIDEDCDYTTVGVRDRDGDGYTDYDEFQVVRSMYSQRPLAILIGGDCNDYVPEMNPRSPEVPGDSVDNNCNGAVDEPPPDEARTHYRRPPV